MAFELTSPAFSDTSKIPAEFTCEGKDASPRLQWRDVPADTKSFALISDDPDAPAKTWVHWVIYNIPGESRELPQGFPHDEALPDGVRQGVNDGGEIGYGGPCPPPGKPHRYYFKLYALDSTLEIEGTATKDKLLAATKGHVLGEAVLMGTYQR
ncbi:MAG: YbhB/YbcL family Raf kinase inhibitor-like protein [Candidatus Omnitrophica bacterium]|nr:YbhB/YbcL family Raf kinase inhibitor-like protein [Candidatus Omnitrophota bacterium]MDD5573813.1 YbhB/YbcL family Raf kinase inhibitor-like protein [Candidatus Omnitrophota bacterium]